MTTQDAFTIGLTYIRTILLKMEGIGLWRTRFLEEIFLLFLGLKGRVNFLQLSRYGKLSDKSYRTHFSEEFNFLQFNIELTNEICSDEKLIGFDPSYISKSGKATPGVGYFYSGVAGGYKRGLEIGCFSLIDVQQNTAYHLESIQSPYKGKKKGEEEWTLIDHYAEILLKRKKEFLGISNILVVDAYFTKEKYVNCVCDQVEMEMISRLRNDANLKYLYNGKQKEGKGRPKKYEGKIDLKKINRNRIIFVFEDEEMAIRSAKVYSVGLKRLIRLVFVEFKDKNGEIATTKLFYSTNLNRDPRQVVKYYKARFQMEFIFRDAKQFAGLNTCESRQKERLHFHHNAALTSVSIARAIYRKKHDAQLNELSVSIADIQTELNNAMLANTILSIYGLDPKLIKNDPRYREILDFGKIAA